MFPEYVALAVAEKSLKPTRHVFAVRSLCVRGHQSRLDDANAVGDVQRIVVLREANVCLLLPGTPRQWSEIVPLKTSHGQVNKC